MGKAPLKLDWEDLLPSKEDDSAPVEIEVVKSNSDQILLTQLSDGQLHDKIQRMRLQLGSSLRDRLPDKGAKLKKSICDHQEELGRRKLVSARKDAEKSMRTRQSEATEPSGPCNDSSPCTATKAQQPSFSSLFYKKLEEKEDPAANGECISISRNKCENLKRNRQRPHENRKKTKLSSQPTVISPRSSPFQCASDLAGKESCCKHAEPSPAGRCSSSSLFKRRRDSEDSHALFPRPRKVQEVVLLDEEEAEPETPILEDAPNDWKETKINYPSRDDQDAVVVSFSDIKCLDPEQYLISPIMNFYIRYLQRPLSPIGQPRGEYHFFNTYFYRKLHEAVSCKGDRKTCFLKLRRWWKGVNIFQKAYIFLPIHGEMHWSLVIICIPAKEDESGPIVLHLDSLKMHPTDTIFEVVGCYLKEEWNYINENGPPPDLPISERIWRNLPCRIEKKKLMVPQQKNEYDCGLFVLYFMERFIDEAPERLKMKDLDMFGSKWFKPEEASGLRKRIRDLLVEEFESARLENGEELESPTTSCSSPENDVQQLIEV